MAIKPSGTSLSLSEIQTEFGGSNPVSLSEYYSGGGNVPAGTVGYPSGGSAVTIPSSGQISVNNFYGATKIPSTLDLRVLLVGGGGAGGQRGAGDNTNGNGGGGAGGLYDMTINRARGSYSISPGKGGMSQAYFKVRPNNDGDPTSAFGFTVYGGGAGGRSDSGAGRPGGSGGGGAAAYGAGGSQSRAYYDSAIGLYGVGNAGAQAGAGGGGGGGGAGGAAGTGINTGKGGVGYTWINDRVYAGGGSASHTSTYQDGGGGRGANDMGATTRALAAVSSRLIVTGNDNGSWWELDISWGESGVSLPSGGYWRYRINGGAWTRSYANGGWAQDQINVGTWTGADPPSQYNSFTLDIQAINSSGAVHTECSSYHVNSATAANQGTIGNAGYSTVRLTSSSYWNWNVYGTTTGDNTSGLYGNHAWFFGGGGGAGTSQGHGGNYFGGSGRDGIVIVSYVWPYQVASGGTVVSSGGRYYHYFTNTAGDIFSW